MHFFLKLFSYWNSLLIHFMAKETHKWREFDQCPLSQGQRLLSGRTKSGCFKQLSKTYIVQLK